MKVGIRANRDTDWAYCRIFERTFILNGDYDLQGENDAIARDEADLIAFGVPFLANPDLSRFRQNAPLNEPDVTIFYVGSAKKLYGLSSPGS
jgi:N-ethylmaleimide reductase